MTINNMTLVKIASVGGIVTVLMGYAAHGKIQGRVKAAPFYKEALKLVRSNPAAVHLLGEPIRDGRIDVGNNRKNFVDGNRAEFQVPLKGSKQKGIMYLSGTKEDGDEQWSIGRIELEFLKGPNKRLVIKGDSKTQINN